MLVILMLRLVRHCSTASRSIAGRIKAVTERHPTPLALSVATGVEASDHTKLLVKKKVAWQHAQPIYEAQYTDFLNHALRRHQWTRLHLVLNRMLVDAVRWGKPTYVDPALLDRCVDSVLNMLVGSRHSSGDRTLLEMAGYLSEIAWRTAHSTETTYPKWELLAAVAADIAYPRSAAYVRALRDLELAICAGHCETVRRALVSVLKSARLSARFLADLYDICVVADDIGSAELLTADLTTDFYLAVLPHLDSQNPDLADMAARISDNLAKDHDTVVVGCLSTHDTADTTSSAVTGKAAAALAHIHLSRGNTALALQAVASFTKLSVRFGWPMHAIARSVELLVGADKTVDACAMLLATANRDHYAFVKILQDSSLLKANAVVLRTLIDDELAIRLHTHRLQVMDHSDSPSAHATNTKQDFSLPITAFFAPNAPVYLKDHDSVKDTIRKYYANLEHILRSATDQQAFTNIAVALVSEASGWVFRLQSPAPLIWLTHALTTHTEALDRESISQLLLEYTRALYDYRMIQYMDASNGTAVYANMLTGYTFLRQLLLREYLRHGIEPPPEALAIFTQHMSISGEHTDAQNLAATIFPQMYPQLTGSQYPRYQAVRSYYERIIELCGAHSSRSQLRLFRYLMGHHGVDCFRYKQRLLEVTVCSFLRHAHFHGIGFYQLERAFVRYVARPWFPAGYLATVLPRFWALHHFLRSRKYVPRLNICRSQFRSTRKGVYVMGITTIPPADKMNAQNIDFELRPIADGDIEAAVHIFMHSPLPKRRSLEAYSVPSMIEKYSKMVTFEP